MRVTVAHRIALFRCRSILRKTALFGQPSHGCGSHRSRHTGFHPLRLAVMHDSGYSPDHRSSSICNSFPSLYRPCAGLATALHVLSRPSSFNFASEPDSSRFGLHPKKRIVMLLCCAFQCEQLLANGPLLKMLPDEYGNVRYLSLRINFHVIRFLVGILEPEPARRIAER